MPFEPSLEPRSSLAPLSRRARFGARAALVVSAFGVVSLVACMDTTPTTDAFVPPPLDSGASEVDAGGAKPGAACLACVTLDPAGPCADKWAKCLSTPKCKPFFECGAEKDCYDPGANVIECLTTCGYANDITSPSDPALVPFIGLRECAIDSCGEPCKKATN